MCTEAPLLVRLSRLQMALSAHLQALPQVWMILWLISFLRSERAGRVGSQRLPWCLSLHKLRETCAVLWRPALFSFGFLELWSAAVQPNIEATGKRHTVYNIVMRPTGYLVSVQYRYLVFSGRALR